jgi:hypothetical protein
MLSPAVVALLVVMACDAGTPAGNKQLPVLRSQLDLKDLPIALPVHGYVVELMGMGGYYDVEVVDQDAHTLRVVVRGWPEIYVRDTTIALAPEVEAELAKLAAQVPSEHQQGPEPDVMDAREDLFIVDHARAFYLTNTLIDWNVGRPIAAALVAKTRKLAVPYLTK